MRLKDKKVGGKTECHRNAGGTDVGRYSGDFSGQQVVDYEIQRGVRHTDKPEQGDLPRERLGGEFG